MTDSLKGWSRRSVLRAGVGTAALLPLAGCLGGGEQAEPWTEGVCDGDPTAVDRATAMQDDPASWGVSEAFALGVQAGAVTSSGVMLWSHAAGEGAVRVTVWREDGSVRLLVKEADAAPKDGYLHVPVDGLAPATAYQYTFSRGEGSARVRSAIGRFRTAYGDDCRRALTIGATTCTNLKSTSPDKPSFRSLEVLARQEIDLLCHLGDMSYNDGAGTLEEYRAKWRSTLANPGYQALLPKTAMYITWDDHEFMNNSELERAPADAIAVAKEAFYEALPVPRTADDRLWRSFKWGKTAEFFVLDSRLERIPSTRTSDDAVYLSREQLNWLKEGLSESTAHFKVVLNSVPIMDLPDEQPLWDVARGDRWEGYATQRTELLDHIGAKSISNVWFLSGDFHLGCVARVGREGPAAKMWEILVGPGAPFSPNPLVILYESLPEEAEKTAPASQFKYFGGAHAATTLTFDTERDAVRIRFIATDDKVLFDEWVSQRD